MDYFLCLKKANNYIMTYPEELEYLNKSRLNRKDIKYG